MYNIYTIFYSFQELEIDKWVTTIIAILAVNKEEQVNQLNHNAHQIFTYTFHFEFETGQDYSRGSTSGFHRGQSNYNRGGRR